ncbi:hypothetical protein H4R18_002624 [Coemansia javaensis]|uniref:Uncharacterized protein n=1 Tax=Coemansia javaensis TaxID=2761396 RepID=A0A9W8HEI8_9FUNG|nr:hypothetical protein H4R18_002624 [Coemansia javaensis]
MDYFALVEARGTEDLGPAEVEAGLAAAAAHIQQHASRAPERIGVLLQRFVYTDQDWCSPRAGALALGVLKALGRGVPGGGEIATGRAIEALVRLAGSSGPDAADDALACVANAMLLQPACRPHVAQRRCLDAVAAVLRARAESPDAAFLCARCLLLALSAGEDARYCVEDLGLQQILADAAAHHMRREAAGAGAGARFPPRQVVAELFKAALGLCTHFLRWVHAAKGSSGRDDALPADRAAAFVGLLRAALDTLAGLPLLADGHLPDPAKQAIAIAMNIPTRHPEEVRDAWLPAGDPWRFVDAILDRLAAMVGRIVGEEPAARLADAADGYCGELTPLALVLMRLVAEHASVREHAFPAFYPGSAIDHSLLPEDRPGLSAKLVRLMRIPQGGMLPAAIGDLLLALLGGDIKHFVMAVGYGNAAGYMVARGIPVPSDIVEQVAAGSGPVVDPVTGRHLGQGAAAAAAAAELAAMTDEEKMREAERLFVLFERLDRTGVIRVENPVRAAAESGRLAEVVDDSDDDSQ